MNDVTVDLSAGSLRSYSDSHRLEKGDASDNIRDMVFTNNHKNEKLNELSQIASNNNNNNNNNNNSKNMEGSNEKDEIDDDWFFKLTHSKDIVREDGTSAPFLIGMNCGEIPLLCNEDLDLKEKTMRTLRVGLKKIWKRGSATITAEDPTYKVAYLGNVLTGWAKGEGCIDKPLTTLWKNYNSSSKPDVQMKITVTQSGLKAVTKDHGLIEYWSHRITYCTVPPGLPRIFCWVYRHEGRKLKQELRCHAVFCSKESVAARMADTLKLRLTQALLEFKRDKLLRQNARLSLANSVYDNPSLPRRKILLSIGSHNYKPPLERSKSAPKLMSIEESLEEEECTPKSKRKFDDIEEPKATEVEEQSKKSLEEKCEYKLANLNFVRKICSSIENLVESTSNYGKKLLTERKTTKDFCISLKKPEESILKKINEEEGKDRRKVRPKRNVSFDSAELAKCTEYKKLEDEEPKEPKALEMVLELGDQESDEGSNSLQSISSCCSDVSSLVTNSSDKSARAEEDAMLECSDCNRETSVERLRAFLSDCDDVLLDKVVFHPTGEEHERITPEAEDSSEEDVTSDESGYVEPTETIERRSSLDIKEKDLPYHKIVKSTVLKPGRTQPSCLHV